ncbi:MAG: hypothetical protein NTV88_00435 [Candidatus Micrarchaeota archaeon]|nr:hypothetical protein [Candidatus Micrarchaeota archaeon]
MGLLGRLKHAKAGIAALALLGIALLIAIDVLAGLVKAESMGASSILIACASLVAALSALAFAWSVFKAIAYPESRSAAGGIIAGAEVGFLSAAIIAAFLFAFALSGHGAARLLPSSMLQQGTAQCVPSYAAICAALLIVYPALGAIIGALVAVFAPVPRIKANAAMGAVAAKAEIKKEGKKKNLLK